MGLAALASGSSGVLEAFDVYPELSVRAQAQKVLSKLQVAEAAIHRIVIDVFTEHAAGIVAACDAGCSTRLQGENPGQSASITRSGCIL